VCYTNECIQLRGSLRSARIPLGGDNLAGANVQTNAGGGVRVLAGVHILRSFSAEVMSIIHCTALI
jgi:hypothetical protein